MFSNLVLKGKLYKGVHLVCDREKGGVLQPEKMAEDHIGTINKTVASVLEGKYSNKKNLLCYVRNVRGDAYFYS